jgi:ATP-dependent Clp protease protease subunit
MATLNGAGRAYAHSLVDAGKVDKSASWSFSAEDGNKLLGPNGDDWENFGKHHLGINPDGKVETKDRYRYPFAKGGTLYRSGLTAIRQRAGQEGDTEIEDAAGTLLDKIDGKKGDQADRPGYRMTRAQNGGSGEIFLYDVIGGGWMGGITAAQFAADLRDMGPVRTLDVRINSDGGDVFEGKAIYSLLNDHPANKSVFVDGLAASIASCVAMAGDTITMSDGAMMMIHNAWGVTVGNAAEHQKQMDLLNSIDKTLCKTYADRTLMDPFKITDMMNAETWMTADECLKNGFCTNISGKTQATARVRDLVARADGRVVKAIDRFRNLPTQLRPRLASAAADEAELRRLIERSRLERAA